MSYQERFWVLLSKKLSEEATLEELKELENIIIDHPEWQYAIQNLEDIWKQKPVKNSINEEDAYMLHVNRMAELNIPFGESPDSYIIRRNSRIRKKWYLAAASIVVIIVVSFLVFIKNDPNKDLAGLGDPVNEISTKHGSKSKIQLPDGSIVLLNAGSRLTYNKDFGKKTREVYLEGEGYFDVKRNTEIPFLIHASNINIKVLGTVFNVRAYPGESKTETSLIHGSIEVTIVNRPSDKIILSPSEKLIVENTENKNKVELNKETEKKEPVEFQQLISLNMLQYNPVDSTVAETLWTENKLVFRDKSFTELAAEMERWYNVSISINNQELSATRFTGIFENETLEQALEALKLSTKFSFEKRGNKIFINR